MKTIIITLAILTVACSSSDNQKQQQNEAVVKGLFDAFNKHDWKTMADHYADSALFLDPSSGKEYVLQSHEQIIEKYSEFESVFPDLHGEVLGVYASGDKVTVEFVASGKSDSLSFSLPIGSVFTLKDGKIIRDAAYYDM